MPKIQASLDRTLIPYLYRMPPTAETTPLFSVITVCFNARKALEKTVEAMRGQSWTDYEHIVVDGASGDGTAAWLRQQQIPRLHWMSEPDNGLYDAMNKGMRMATGRYLWFVNAGDTPESADTLGHLAVLAQEEKPDVLFGEVHLVDAHGRVAGTRSALTTQKLPARLTWKSLRWGMVVSHQGFLVKRTLAPEYLNGNLCADIDWVIRCLKNARSVRHTGLVLARFEMGGLSRQRHRQSLSDRYRVMQHHYGVVSNLLAHGWILVRGLWHRMTRQRNERY